MKKQFNIYSLGIIAAATLWAAPTHAQWLVQDNNLYELIQTEVVKEQLKPLNDKFEISGDGKGQFKTGTPDDNSSDFNNLTLTTKDLLNKTKESDNYKADADAFFKETTPNCNKKSNTLVLQNCKRMRNLMGAQLKEIQDISKNLEARNRALQNSIMNANYDTTGELQKKQYEISLLQAIIANDNMRLKTAIASYQAMRDLYRTQYEEALQNRVAGKDDDNNNMQVTAKKIFAVGAAAATFMGTKAMIDNNWKSEIFKDRGSVQQVIRSKR